MHAFVAYNVLVFKHEAVSVKFEFTNWSFYATPAFPLQTDQFMYWLNMDLCL